MSESEEQIPQDEPGLKGWISERTGSILYDLITHVPSSHYQISENPTQEAEELIRKACISTSLISGGLSIPGGLLGVATILPDLANIWRMQSQLVVDIAAIHGKLALVRQEDLIWCLFRHAAAQVARDFIIRTGQQMMLAQLSSKAMQTLLRKLSLKTAEKMGSRIFFRALPILGMGGAAAYAWLDTRDVGKTALELFQQRRALPAPCEND